MKATILLPLLAQLIRSTHAQPPSPPMTTIAGVRVINTPIVQDALAYAKANGDSMTYKHIVRSWLFGALEIAHTPALAGADLEVHALAAILHDLGWDQTPGSPLISADKRFEVDGAIGARGFIRAHRDGRAWDERRVQLVWDAIALHATPSIAAFKEPVVGVVSVGILDDVQRPSPRIDPAVFERVVKEFPNEDLKLGVENKITWFCQSKPATTYDNWMQPFGERFVANYSAIGNRIIDVVLTETP